MKHPVRTVLAFALCCFALMARAQMMSQSLPVSWGTAGVNSWTINDAGIQIGDAGYQIWQNDAGQEIADGGWTFFDAGIKLIDAGVTVCLLLDGGTALPASDPIAKNYNSGISVTCNVTTIQQQLSTPTIQLQVSQGEPSGSIWLNEPNASVTILGYDGGGDAGAIDQSICHFPLARFSIPTNVSDGGDLCCSYFMGGN